jgi:hypothetical protein
MTLSEDEINYKIFKIVTKKLKNELADRAAKIKQDIMDATYKYCNETTDQVRKSYFELKKLLVHDPLNERELIETKAHIASAPAVVDKNTDALKEVYQHYLMLEDFSYIY